jgi:hypothetical protein
MMKAIWTILALSVATISPAAAGGDLHGLPELPQKRVSITILQAMPATDLLKFAVSQSDLRLDLADEIKTNGVSFKFRFDDADTRDAIAWSLRFLNADAVLTNDTLRVFPRSPLPANQARQYESAAVPSARLAEFLGRPFDQDRTLTFPAHQVLEWVLHRAGIHNSVFAPECSQEMKDVTVTAGSRRFRDVLTDVCNQAHLQWSLQWGAVFIEPKDKKGNAQPESGHVRK